MTDERDNLGRFTQGNRAAAGHTNRMAKKRQALTDMFLRELKPADFKAIIKKLIALARDGDIQAIRECLDRSMGKCLPYEPPEEPKRVSITLELPEGYEDI